MVDNWNDLSIGQYDDIRFILSDKVLSDADKDICLLSVLSGISGDVIKAKPVDEVADMISSASFLGKAYDGEVMGGIFRYGGYTFDCDFSHRVMTYAQVMDAENTVQYADLISCLMVPVGHSYHDGYKVDWRGIPYVVAKGVIESFMNGMVDSVSDTTHAILRRMKVRRVWRDTTREISLLKDIRASLSLVDVRI